MKRLLQLTCLVAVAGLAWLGRSPAQTAPAEEAALKLWKSLSEEQKKEALLPFGDPERYKEFFTPIKRPGLTVNKLNKEQKELLEQALAAITTKYGAERMTRDAKQTSESGRYLTFYGTPEKGKVFAWRLALHHLTVVYVEFGADTPGEFGPILLGGNPVGDMWDEEDRLFLELYAALSKDELAKASGKGGKGVKVGELSAKPKELAVKLLDKRLEVFNPEYRKNFDTQLKNDGGAKNLYLSITAKDASKSHHKGGRYYWRIAGEHVFCDWQIQDNEHLHLTLRASPVKKNG
jgi:hypothetical protein